LNAEARNYIEKLHLEPHPEGGFFREVYRSGEIIQPEGLPERFRKGRVFSTSIYFLLEGSQVSNFHRIKSDEIWHYYDGCGVKIFTIDNTGLLSQYRLGKNTEKNEEFQVVIRNNNWFAAELIDKKSFCLIGCTVSPGFEFIDFELAARQDLIEVFPQHRDLIMSFTAG
jgi:predicted cupin superfamily sugar epimerase